jgi:hypothetical protein
MSRRIICTRRVAFKQEESSSQKVLVEKLKGNETLKRHRNILENNIKVNLKEMKR